MLECNILATAIGMTRKNKKSMTGEGTTVLVIPAKKFQSHPLSIGDIADIASAPLESDSIQIAIETKINLVRGVLRRKAETIDNH